MRQFLTFVFVIASTLTTSHLVSAIPGQQRVHGPQNPFLPRNPQNFGNTLNNLQNNVNTEDNGFVFDGPADRPPNRDINTVPTARPRTTTSTTQASQTASSTMNSCETSCPTTPEYNPVCGTDGVLYSNPGKLGCAKQCGKSVDIRNYGTCITSASPLRS